MSEDREILRDIWEGRLPVCFRLASEEIDNFDQPEPYYLMVPRLSYFPIVLDKVKKHFLHFVKPEIQEASPEMWLEVDGQPLKWHYPIGVLFDLYSFNDMLPWNITVHFEKFPETEVIHCPSREFAEAHFMSSIKEADALKHRGLIASAMLKKDHNQLWLGLLNDKFDQFWAINRKLMEHSEDGFKFIPFRIYQCDKPFVQKLVRPVLTNGELATFKDLVQECIPDCSVFDTMFLVQGIQPPWDTPIQWLSEHFSHPDNFLHICAIKSNGV